LPHRICAKPTDLKTFLTDLAAYVHAGAAACRPLHQQL
jgi:hypothetical protein